MQLIRRIWIAITLFGLVLGIWGFWWEPSSLRVRRDSVEVPRWPEALDSMRVAVLTDLHIGSPYKGLDSLRKLVRRTNELEPDLILLPGDFVIQGVLGGTFVRPEEIVPELAKLHAPLGVFAVMGNHDWWLRRPREMIAAFEQNGVPLLLDQAVRVDTGKAPFWVMGIGDFWETDHDVDAALAMVTDDAPVIAFTHNPDIFPDMPARVNLTIAGHTHGGQVYIPFVGRPVVPSEFGERYAIDEVREDGRVLYVSSGVGTSMLPVRFLVPPEITMLELKAPR
ncbi:MAG: metallophosphoesterase [Acidobacteria bacterium]|nr:metallophosphoesterase [Acidobacteriota bacterium]